MRGAAYRKVAKALRETAERVTTGKQAQKLPGIGKSSAEKARACEGEEMRLERALPCAVFAWPWACVV